MDSIGRRRGRDVAVATIHTLRYSTPVRRNPERKSSPHQLFLAELRGIYAQVDALFAGFACDASADCCHFARTGREPYPSAIEIAELERAIAARGGVPKKEKRDKRRLRQLPQLDERRCVLLGEDDRCTVYASRPLGCRTFFCERGHGAAGEPPPAPRDPEVLRVARAIADLSARFAPADPGPRPLSKVIAAWDSRSR